MSATLDQRVDEIRKIEEKLVSVLLVTVAIIMSPKLWGITTTG